MGAWQRPEGAIFPESLNSRAVLSCSCGWRTGRHFPGNQEHQSTSDDWAFACRLQSHADFLTGDSAGTRPLLPAPQPRPRGSAQLNPFQSPVEKARNPHGREEMALGAPWQVQNAPSWWPVAWWAPRPGCIPGQLLPLFPGEVFGERPSARAPCLGHEGM